MKSALFTWGGWNGHQPKVSSERFVFALKRHEYAVTVTDSLDACADTDYLQTFDLLVLCWTMGALSDEQEVGLLNAVRSGVGFAGWHGGMADAFRDRTGYHFMVGGQFVAHPGNVIDFGVKISRDDPITAGLDDFMMHSEQYFMHVDPSNEVLATTTFNDAYAPWIDGTVMPVAWKKRYGEGHVFYSALGHAPSDFDVPEAQTIMERGMLWATR